MIVGDTIRDRVDSDLLHRRIHRWRIPSIIKEALGSSHWKLGII
jgi:hypothetical protein